MTISDTSCHNLQINSTGDIQGWEGIPEAFVFNGCIALVLLIILAILRVIYYNRGFSDDWDSDWLEFIYSDRSADLLHDENMMNPYHPNAYLPPCLHEYSSIITNQYNSKHSTPRRRLYYCSKRTPNVKAKHQAKLDNVGKDRYWLWDYILITDKDILEHRGRDAFHYLLFQRYIIYFLTALSVICMVVLLPTNIYGQAQTGNILEMTTINNIRDDSPILWVHTVSAIMITLFGVVLMKQISEYVLTPFKESDDRTIFIEKIPEQKRNAKALKRFIEKTFKGVRVSRVTFVYDVEWLRNLNKEIIVFLSSLAYCEKYKAEYGRSLEVSPYYCGRFFPLCDQLDGITYYKYQIRVYRNLVMKEVGRTLSDPKQAVFVQLKKAWMAEKILDKLFYTRTERLLNRYFETFKSCLLLKTNDKDKFGYNGWKSQPAPFPEDIEWSDMIMSDHANYLCSILSNLLIIVIFIFLTTPLMALNFLKEILIALGIDSPIQDLFGDKDITIGNFKITSSKLMSVLLLNGFSCLLPNLILLIGLLVPQESKSEKNSKIMKMVYVYLILMVVIFPSLGIISGQLFLKKALDRTLPKDFYKCIFTPTSSIFFIHYVISCIFVNNSAQLLRLPELGLYIWNSMIYPRTRAEFERARMETNFQFSYSSNYPRFLLISTIVTTFAVACPILPPLGLLYMFLKHLVDRYCIYFLYSTQVISPNIHQNAICFVMISFFFLLLQLTTFLNIRNEFSFTFKPSNICNIVLFLYLIFLIFYCFNFNKLCQDEYRRLLFRKNTKRVHTNTTTTSTRRNSRKSDPPSH